MERIYAQQIKPEDDGKKVYIKGWIKEIRDLGKICFLVLRDISGTIQITASKDKIKEELFNYITTIPKQSIVAVEGIVKKSNQAPLGREIIPEKVDVIAKSEPILPIDISDFSKTELSKRLDYRYLDLHNSRTQSIFKIQAEISFRFREFFYNNGFIEIQPPSIIASASEGGTELFPVMYFEKSAFLAQSPQLYKQMCACSLEKVFCITPVWRAEKHNTTRHLNESRQMDIEMAFADEFLVMNKLSKVVKYIIEKVNNTCKRELSKLNIKLKTPKEKYITYTEVVDLLKELNVKIDYGEDISPEGEKKLGTAFPDTIIFIHDWPLSLKPFYIMPKTLQKKESLSRGFDALYKGMEISSGGQRIHIPEVLTERLRSCGLNPENFRYYIDSFRYGSPEHAGWSIGLERFTMALLNLDNIREACLFPRDRDRLVP